MARLKKAMDRLLHQRTALRIAADLNAQGIAVGTRLSSLRELAVDYGVSYQTMHKTLGLLRERGLVAVRKGDGIYLRRLPTADDLPEAAVGGASVSRSLPSRRSIAVVHPAWASDEYPDHYGQGALLRILNGFLAECDPYHWGIETVYSAPPDEAAHPSFVDKIMHRGAGGVLWLRPNLGHRMNLMRLVDRGVEVLCCGRLFPELNIPTISEDHAAAARMAAAWLKKLGKKRVGILSGPVVGRYADPFAVELLDIYNRHFGKNPSIDPTAVFQGFGLPPAELEILLKAYFARHPDVGGFLCVFNPLLAPIHRLITSGDLPDLGDRAFVDLNADYWQPLHGESLPFRIAAICNPLENLGRHLARHFVSKWATPPDSTPPSLRPKLLELA